MQMSFFFKKYYDRYICVSGTIVYFIRLHGKLTSYTVKYYDNNTNF